MSATATRRKRGSSAPAEPTGWDGGWWECAATCPADTCPRRTTAQPVQDAPLPLRRRVAHALGAFGRAVAVVIVLLLAGWVAGQLMLASHLDVSARTQVAVMYAAVVVLAWTGVILRKGRKR